MTVFQAGDRVGLIGDSQQREDGCNWLTASPPPEDAQGVSGPENPVVLP